MVPAGTEIPHNETATFACSFGFVVQGPEVYRCHFGDFQYTQNQKSECVAGIITINKRPSMYYYYERQT